jgi:L-2-hydroxyglutarate oxidase
MIYDLAVIGAGIIGVATARAIQELFPNKKIIILEKEDSVAKHQTGKNSGVLHSGIYYKPNSLKAEFCLAGKRKMLEFCDRFNITYKKSGKLIVATSQSELSNLMILKDQGHVNGIELRYLNADQIKDFEPYVNGVAALYIPEVAVLSFQRVVIALIEQIIEHGGQVCCNHEVLKISQKNGIFHIETNHSVIHTKFIINAAGLYSDKIAKMLNEDIDLSIVPFRGEYYILSKEASKYCNSLIYPVPNPELPFLGVHLTRTIDQKVKCGPNAILALSREGYNWSDLRIQEFINTISDKGFIKFAIKNWSIGIEELLRSLIRERFLKSIQKLVPEVQNKDLIQKTSGVRAQAISKNGTILSDFCLLERKNAIHILNAPSPAATASIAIAEKLAGVYSKITS